MEDKKFRPPYLKRMAEMSESLTFMGFFYFLCLAIIVISVMYARSCGWWGW